MSHPLSPFVSTEVKASRVNFMPFKASTIFYMSGIYMVTCTCGYLDHDTDNSPASYTTKSLAFSEFLQGPGSTHATQLYWQSERTNQSEHHYEWKRANQTARHSCTAHVSPVGCRTLPIWMRAASVDSTWNRRAALSDITVRGTRNWDRLKETMTQHRLHSDMKYLSRACFCASQAVNCLMVRTAMPSVNIGQ